MKFKVGDRVKCVKHHDGNTKVVGKVGTVIKVSNICSDYLIEFDVNVNGHGGCGAGKNGHCWWLFDRHLELARDKNECIVIYRKDNTVTALNKATGDKAVAKCNPADEFDFMTGAKLAFERLVTPSAVKAVKVGDWVKVLSANGHSLTVGKIYKVVTVHKIPKGWVRVDKGDGSYDTLRDNQYEVVPDYVAPAVEEPKLYNGKVVCVCSKSRFVTKGKLYEVVDGKFTYDDGDTDGKFKNFSDFQSRMFSEFIEVVE